MLKKRKSKEVTERELEILKEMNEPRFIIPCKYMLKCGLCEITKRFCTEVGDENAAD